MHFVYPMKNSLLLAASTAAATISLGGAAKTEPLNMFYIQTPSNGVINFSANGSPNLNQSLESNKIIDVPSRTNLGVTTHSGATLSSVLMQASSIGGSQGMTQVIGISGNETDGYTITSETTTSKTFTNGF